MKGRGGGRADSRHATVYIAALEMLTWTSSVILSVGVAIFVSLTAEWRLCERGFHTFLAPWLLFQANASSYHGMRGTVISWASAGPCDNHHPCIHLSKSQGMCF